MNETNAFDDFDEALKLNPSERLRAELCHREITALLKANGLITTAFLQGSFARKTMVCPLRDIDKVVILTVALQDVSPDDAMDRLEAVLADRYPQATFSRTRHSLKLDFGNESFCFDIVPAHETTTDDDDVLIANRAAQNWQVSNTRTLIRVVADRNQACDGRFVHVVRMIKHLVAGPMDELIPGLHVESLVFVAVTTSMPYAEACLASLEAGAVLLGGVYADPTGRDQLSDRLTPDQRVRAQAAFSSAANRAGEARRLADAGDHENAIRVWHGLFGDPFPEAASQPLDTALTVAVGGTITSSGHVSATTAGRQSAPPTRSWQHLR